MRYLATQDHPFCLNSFLLDKKGGAASLLKSEHTSGINSSLRAPPTAGRSNLRFNRRLGRQLAATLPYNIAAMQAASCLRLRYLMQPKNTRYTGSAAPPVLGKILGRRFAEPASAWTRGKFLPPPKNLPPCKEQADFGGKI